MAVGEVAVSPGSEHPLGTVLTAAGSMKGNPSRKPWCPGGRAVGGGVRRDGGDPAFTPRPLPAFAFLTPAKSWWLPEWGERRGKLPTLMGKGILLGLWVASWKAKACLRLMSLRFKTPIGCIQHTLPYLRPCVRNIASRRRVPLPSLPAVTRGSSRLLGAVLNRNTTCTPGTATCRVTYPEKMETAWCFGPISSRHSSCLFFHCPVPRCPWRGLCGQSACIPITPHTRLLPTPAWIRKWGWGEETQDDTNTMPGDNSVQDGDPGQGCRGAPTTKRRPDEFSRQSSHTQDTCHPLPRAFCNAAARIHLLTDPCHNIPS
ncbi:uncharacterized protein LOC110350686 [Heterocephalus glaber]|uniref:Uncharacterized protein LOC110350686 n=1 Tax=Heterocephalus glaber TaxID=10181 RepID=A0AAX6TIE3_HETGA|nr:uncharacterized protein LOC110350686 [Heterocephalus glaber]